ncbi:unnamed protein product [Effrenium voratum]|nr:unnamed protein product [Effrenium voratum]
MAVEDHTAGQAAGQADGCHSHHLMEHGTMAHIVVHMAVMEVMGVLMGRGERSAESEQKGVGLELRDRNLADRRGALDRTIGPKDTKDLFSIGTLEFQVLRFNAASYSEQGFRATMEAICETWGFGRALQLSLDHKPSRADEAKRIEEAGGFVSFHRVLGRLAVSRAFGDAEYKVGVTRSDVSQPLVIAEPEIRVEQLTPEDEFLFMACDGLFAVFSCQEAVDFLHSRLAAMPANEQDPERAVRDIVHEAIHERRSRDNVTALLVTFRRAVLTKR